MKRELPVVLGVGAHLKNAVALSVGDNIFVSQHIGDLETPEAFSAFNSVIESFKALYEVEPESVVCDDHPDYLSTHYARSSQIPILTAQHHYAHVLACMAENEVEPPVLGISWDGTGYGLDGTVWGGEFLEITDDHFLRRGHLREFLLPGGEQAIQYPARTAVGLLFEVFGHDLWGQRGLPPIDFFSAEEQRILSAMMEKGINSPRASSAGRLFDGVSSLLGIRQEVRFEGQAAMELEFATEVQEEALSYPFLLSQKDEGDSGPGTVVDWQPMIFRILQDLDSKPTIGYIAAKFHRTLSDMILAFARQVGFRSVVLTGGCFQNRLLLESAVISLRQEGFRPYWHRRFPPNDGGIALGQVIAALRQGKD
jgi:hydrogenase maturation protein HypF